MIVGITWHIHTARSQAQLELVEESKVIAAQVLAFRQVIAENQHKINYDSKGNFEFKHLNPAAVTMKASQIFNENTSYKIRLVSLNPRDLTNTPDAFERNKLLEFKRNSLQEEVWEEDVINGQAYFRYMVPLRIDVACLPCHGTPKGEPDISGNLKEGYKPGELAGALSISIPTALKATSLKNLIRQNVVLTILVIIFSASVIILHTRIFVTRPINSLVEFSQSLAEGHLTVAPKEFKAYGEIGQLTDNFRDMACRLKEMYDELDLKVKERTSKLVEVNRELTRISKYKSEFLANMSHELRTPLTSIIAFTEELVHESKGRISLEQEDYLKEIKDSGNQLLDLINDLLDLSKIESGKMILDLTEVDVAEVLLQNVKLIRPLAEQKALKIEVSFSNTPIVIADLHKVGQVIRNLLSNAIKFSPTGQVIKVELQAVSCEQEGVILKVKDNGPGMTSKETRLIFDTFYQAETGLNRNYPGTGLGLALVRKIMNLHLGWVRVKSTPGKGATFSVFWPSYPPFDSELE